MPTLLIVDDEPNVLYSLQAALGSDELRVLTAATAAAGIEIAQTDRPDAVILDVRLPDMSGLDAFERLRQSDPRLPVIIVTAYTTTETAIEAMHRGAFEYLLKPLDFHELRQVVRKALEVSRLSRVPAVIDPAEAEDRGADRIVGDSPRMQEVYKAIGRVAGQDVTVLIQGESGTGKELVARAIYHYSRRNGRPFLAINCAAIPEALLESELFGHERGAFTGAESRRPGKFEQAHGGTIFLDEIADMSPATQAKVLRVLQEQRFERVGSNDPIQVDVRVVAATNQDLEAAVGDGRFRQDLFYRLNVFTISLPPLRQRLNDLPILVQHFVKTYCRQLDRRVRLVTNETYEALAQHRWPGNVRELQSVVKYAIVHATEEVVTPDCLPDYLRSDRPATGDQPTPPAAAGAAGPAEPTYTALTQLVEGLIGDGKDDLHRRVHTELDRVLIREVLRTARGNQLEAAQLLGISRNTLRARMRALGMAVEKQILTDSGAIEFPFEND